MRARSWAIAFVLIFIGTTAAVAATLSWTGPTLYTDGTAIPSAKIATITYKTYYGSSASGPWTAGPVTGAGALSASVAEPAPGTTQWYTLEAALDNQVSGKAVAVSKTSPFKNPNPPGNLWIQ